MMDSDERTELLRLVEDGDTSGVARRLYEGLDVNTRLSPDGDTMLFAAIREQQEDIVRLLVSEGADLTARDQDWLEPVHIAARYSNVNIIETLLKGGADVNRQSEGLCMVALFLAVRWQQHAMVRLLLDRGADATLQVGQGQKADTGFHYCIKNRDAEMTEVFLAAGVPLDVRDGKRQQPLHIAAASDESGALVQRLLDCGADVHAEDQIGDTALHVAVLHGNIRAITALCMAGSNMNRLNNKQLTPAHLAVSMGRLEAIKLLIQLGANVDKPGLDDLTPLLYCHAPLVLNLCFPLWEGNCSQDTIGELCTTHHAVHMSILEALIQAGCDVNKADAQGRRLLNYVVKGGVQSEAAVRRLLLEGADHDMCSGRGTTLLMAAVLNGHRSTTHLVLRFCPSLVGPTPPTLPNGDGAGLLMVGVSALVVAARYRDIELITAMLQSGYRPTQRELGLIALEDQSSNKVPTDEAKFSAVKQLVGHSVRNAPSLLLSCRVAVRMTLNNKLYKRVMLLDIPSRLKDLLLLKDVLGT